jgi:hypothetical protein
MYKIQFPNGYVPSLGQEVLMNHVLRALDRSEFALVDCPTGPCFHHCSGTKPDVVVVLPLHSESLR